ncbi:MAG TPA: protein YgfX [Burkholderiales bacterium]|nr:protein YgfX [Burkholderiales bacterium]
MSGSRSLRLQLSPSPAFATALVALHASAALCILLVLPSVAGAALAICLMALGLAAAWSRALLKSASSVRAIELEAGGASFELAGGERFAARLTERRYVNRFMVALPVRGRLRRTVLVTLDMLGEESFRVLRIWALWGKLPQVAAQQLPA